MAMTLKDASGVLQTITAVQVKDGSSMRSIVRMKVMDGATLRTVATFVQPLTASAPAGEFTRSFDSETMTSDPVTCTPSGGLAPYTYLWTVVSGTVSITTPTAASTTFSKTVTTPSVQEFATVRCTVTDSAGSTATDDVALTFIYNDGLGS